MQLATKDNHLPEIGYILTNPIFKVYVLTSFEILTISPFRDNDNAAKIGLIGATSDHRPSEQSQPTATNDQQHSNTLALLTRSTSTAFAKEEAKVLALRRIMFNHEDDIKFFLMNTGQIDNWHCLSAAIMRLPEYLRKMPAFSGDNLKAFVLLRFSHIPVKDCWYIGSMATSPSGHFASINDLAYALPNLEQAFANIFKHNSTGKLSFLMTNALAQWKSILADQCEPTSIKNLPIDFIESRIMESLCNFAQALLDPALERVREPDVVNDKLVAAAAVDERNMRVDGDRVRLNRLDDSKTGSKAQKSSTLPANGKRKLDATGSGQAIQPWRQIASGSSSSASSGAHAGSTQSTAPSNQGRIAHPCLHHITYQLFCNDTSGKFIACKSGGACKFHHYQIPIDQNGAFQFESADVKNHVVNSTKNIKDNGIRTRTRQALEAIPAKV